MTVEIYKDYETLSDQVAQRICQLVEDEPKAVLCLAAGDTPRLAFTLIAGMAKKRKINFSECTFVGLDEWVGIGPENPGSCHYFLRHHLFDPLQVKEEQIHLFNSLAGNIEAECSKMDSIISEKGGIDLMLVGVGMNGHIGFNEPGVSPQLYSHIIDLDATTQSVGQKYFKESTVLKKGITLGLQHLLESKKAILMASGEKKSGVIEKALEGPITPDMPASIIRKHKQGCVMIDQQAASLLKNTSEHANK
jgi:glucosamine-6-phosphate isomerase